MTMARFLKEFTVTFLTIAAGVSSMQAASVAPDANISALSLEGMAPFAVHVNGLNSTVGTGTALTAQFAWSFGDPYVDHNRLDGWNAAHIYNQPGTYQISLTVTNEAGLSDTAVATVTVHPDTRAKIYVAASGSDSYSGTSPAWPLRTYQEAVDRLQNDHAILLRRGDTFDISGINDIDFENIVIGTYGSGPRPRLRWTGGFSIAALIGMTGECRDVVIEDLHFDSIYEEDADDQIANAVYPAGQNVTVRNCYIENLTYAFNCNRNPVGFLALNNDADVLGAYFSWIQGSDHTYLGNSAQGSLNAHVIRVGNGQRILIARNELHAPVGRCIWAMLGQHCYVTENVLDDGGVSVGPNPFLSNATDRFRWMTIERNEIPRTGGSFNNVEVLAGAEHVMVRNNIVSAHGGVGIHVAGHDSEYNRLAVDVHLLNNTGLNNFDSGQFVVVGNQIDGLRLVNNLYSAPNLVTGQYQAAVIYVEDSNLNSFDEVSRNVWSTPADYAWIDDAYHYVWPYWSDPIGYKTPVQWNQYEVVENDAHVSTTFGPGLTPIATSPAATHSIPTAGVFNDFNGTARPLTGQWSAGAVEAGTVAAVLGDLNTDGLVSGGDLIYLLNDWGATNSASDLNHNGRVDGGDLIILLNAWTGSHG